MFQVEAPGLNCGPRSSLLGGWSLGSFPLEGAGCEVVASALLFALAKDSALIRAASALFPPPPLSNACSQNKDVVSYPLAMRENTHMREVYCGEMPF